MPNPISNLTGTYAKLIEQSVEYWTDAAQRSALYLDTMRKRGNIYIEHAVQGKPALLKFEHELLIDGTTLERPCNYSLLKILPDAKSAPVPDQRPVVIVDPRAGHGPGIGFTCAYLTTPYARRLSGETLYIDGGVNIMA